MVALAECEWKVVPSDILQELEDIAGGFKNTKVCEDATNVLREQCRHAKAGLQGRKRRMSTSMKSSLLPEADRPLQTDTGV